jgi:hypothetical protein
MKNIIPILFLSLVFAQDSVYDKIVEDHNKAVQDIFDEQIVEQNKQLERILAKEDYSTLTTQAYSSALGFFASYATESPIPWIIGSTIVPLMKIRKINKSNDSIELKNERKKRVKRNVQLGSIPFLKWYIILFRTPKAIIDNIS